MNIPVVPWLLSLFLAAGSIGLPADGTDYYYGRISAGHGADDEIYAVGYASWEDAWDGRFESGDGFVGCFQ